jgi:hypothetical protein
MRPALISFLIAGLLGFAGAKLIGGKTDDDAPVSAVQEIAVSRVERKRWTSDDLAKWARAKGLPGNSGSRDDWQEWSNDELRAAMDEAVRDPGMAVDASAAIEVLKTLFEESLKRDFDGSVSWFEGLVSDVVKRNLGSVVALNWPKDRAEEGLDYAIANRDSFETIRGTSAAPIILAAVESAAKRGPEELDALFGKLRENNLDPQYGQDWEFPADFDFKGLMAGAETKMMARNGNLFFSGIWMSRDPEAAYQSMVVEGMMEGRRPQNLFSDVLPVMGVAQREKARERARWLIEKIYESPDGAGEVARQVLRDLKRAPEAMAEFAQGAKDAADRQIFFTEGIKQMADSGPQLTLAFLQAIDDVAVRVDLLENTDFKAANHYYQQWLMTAELERTLRGKLIEWQVSATRADEIINRMKAKR